MTTAPKLIGRKAERARSKFIESALRWLRASTVTAKGRAEDALKLAAVALSEDEVRSLLAAAQRQVARDR